MWPSTSNAARIPNESQAQLANHERPAASTRYGVGTAENGIHHADLGAVGLEHEHVRLVQPP